jgi:hypothetical protein
MRRNIKMVNTGWTWKHQMIEGKAMHGRNYWERGEQFTVWPSGRIVSMYRNEIISKVWIKQIEK